MRALAITGMETAEMMPSIMSGSLIRDTPPWARMSAGTRSSAMTATAPASSAILACSAVTTSMMTPPLSISAMPRFTRDVPTPSCSPFEPVETVCAMPPMVGRRGLRPLLGGRCRERLLADHQDPLDDGHRAGHGERRERDRDQPHHAVVDPEEAEQVGETCSRQDRDQ